MNLNFISLDNNDFEKEIEINNTNNDLNLNKNKIYNTNNDLNYINLLLNSPFLFLLINNFYKIKDEITEDEIIKDEINEDEIINYQIIENEIIEDEIIDDQNKKIVLEYNNNFINFLLNSKELFILNNIN